MWSGLRIFVFVILCFGRNAESHPHEANYGKMIGNATGPLAAHTCETSKVKEVMMRSGSLKKPDTNFIEETGMKLLLPEYDRLQSILVQLLKDRREKKGGVTRSFIPEAPTGGKLRLSCGGYTTGGQDAFTVDGEFFSVADGVGGSSVSPSNFAKHLTDEAARAYRAITDDEHGEHRPKTRMREILRQAHIKAIQKEAREIAAKLSAAFLSESYASQVASSATFLAAHSTDGRELNIGNIGDGGVSLHRRSAANRFIRSTVFVTEPHEKSWNQPLQITSQLDEIEDGYGEVDFYSVPLREGDMIVAASDGFIDNLYFPEVDSVATRAVSPYESKMFSDYARNRSMTSHLTPLRCPSFPLPSGSDEELKFATPPGLLAKYLALTARWSSTRASALAPFNIGHERHLGHQAYLHGKRDDTTVVVCWAVSADAVAIPWELADNRTSNHEDYGELDEEM